MTARLYPVDSGGVTRRVKKLFVVDSGGVTRNVKKAFIIDSAGVPRLIFTRQQDFTIVAGAGTGSSGYAGPLAGSFGSISPSANLDDTGRFIEAIVFAQLAPFNGFLEIGGFSSDPGQGYITSLLIGTQTFGQGTSYSYSSGSGIATWNYSSGIKLVGGTSYPIVLTR